MIGTIFFSNQPLTYFSLLLVGLIWYALFKTTWGLRTRAIGEHPSAAETVGVSVAKMRYLNLIIGGGIAGLAGAYLSLEAVGSFERNMTNGKGFVALAVMILMLEPSRRLGSRFTLRLHKRYTNTISVQRMANGHPQFTA